jgi:uncharacterized Zn-binding protein involved in type VI secretion
MYRLQENTDSGVASTLGIFSWSEQMVRQVIVVGDTLSPHGGTVTTGSNADIVDGKPISRKGDTVECKEHGKQTISEGDESCLLDGQPVALQGHHAACGCTLVSRGTTLSIG